MWILRSYPTIDFGILYVCSKEKEIGKKLEEN